MDSSFFELNLHILTEGGVEIEESVELALGEDEGCLTRLILSFLDAVLDGLLFGFREDDRALVRFPEPDCTTGGEANGEEDDRSQ